MRLRIAYLTVSIIPSRTANSVHVMRMCQAYARLGHRVTLWVPAWRHGREPGVRDLHAFYGVEPIFALRQVPMPPRPLQLPHLAGLLPLFAATGRPDLVHSRGLASAWGAARLFRLPTLFETHAATPENPRRRSLFESLVRSSSLRAVAAVSGALAAQIAPDLPDGLRILVAPDGVDRVWIDRAPTREEARHQLDLAGERRRIAIYTGHLYAGRGVELIVELARQRPDHLFLLVGGREDDLASWRRRAGDLDNLHFAGFRPPAEMPLWLAAADALLMPYAGRVAASGGGDISAWISPMKMFEYLAAGRPILASTLPALGEVLEHERNALLLPHDEPGRWSEALARLASQPALAGGLAERARTDAGRYTWEERARRLLTGCGLAPGERAADVAPVASAETR